MVFVVFGVTAVLNGPLKRLCLGEVLLITKVCFIQKRIYRLLQNMALSFQLLFGLSQTVNVAILVILCVWVVVYDGGLDWSPNYRQQFNWHKIALTLGLVNITAVGLLFDINQIQIFFKYVAT